MTRAGTMLLAIAITAATAACARVPAADGSSPSCRPPGLEHASLLAAWTPPPGCTWAVDRESPFHVIADDQAFAAALHCNGPVASFDFAGHELVVGVHAPGSLSFPLVALASDAAGAGVTVLEQGYADRCDGDPVPAPPYDVPYAFVAPRAAALVASRVSCTIKKSCP